MGTLAVFAALALLLAVIGLYGVLSYTVAQRTQEMGVRLALGAAPRQIARLVVGDGLRLAIAGVVLGVLAASLVVTAMSKLLFGITPLDPATFIAAAGLLLAVSLPASYIPARRAARVDPMVALRCE